MRFGTHDFGLFLGFVPTALVAWFLVLQWLGAWQSGLGACLKGLMWRRFTGWGGDCVGTRSWQDKVNSASAWRPRKMHFGVLYSTGLAGITLQVNRKPVPSRCCLYVWLYKEPIRSGNV